MKQLITEVERLSITVALQSLLEKNAGDKTFKRYRRIFFAGDDNFICDYLMHAVNGNKAAGIFKTAQYLSANNESEYRMNTLNSLCIPAVPSDALRSADAKDNLVFFFVDTTDLQRKDATVEELKKVGDMLSGLKNSRCVITALLPEIETFPGDATELSERELSFFMEKICERTPESEYYFQIEKICRGFVRDGGLDVVILRFDNVFAPDRFHTPSLPLQKIISECEEAKKITITDEDEKLTTSVTYIRNACHAVFNAAYCGLKGHIYNVAYSVVSASDVKQSIFGGCKDFFSLSMHLSGKAEKKYNALGTLVFKKLKIKSVINFQNAVNCAVAYLTDYFCPDLLEKIDILYRD